MRSPLRRVERKGSNLFLWVLVGFIGIWMLGSWLTEMAEGDATGSDIGSDRCREVRADADSASTPDFDYVWGSDVNPYRSGNQHYDGYDEKLAEAEQVAANDWATIVRDSPECFEQHELDEATK